MRSLSGILAVSLLIACGGAPSGDSPPARSQAGTQPATSAPAVEGPAIVAFGDSLTAGYGAPPGESYPDFLQRELLERGFRYRVVNEGVSGDTTAMALQRVDLAIADRPAYVIVALGGNDGLRGLPTETMEENLREMISRFRAAGSQVIVAGMTLPPNFGEQYIREFESVFPRIAKECNVPLIPFLLQGVAADPKLNQDDGIHPTAAGNRIIARTVADALTPLLDRSISE